MKTCIATAIFCVLITFNPAQAQTIFQVNSTGNSSDQNPGDGICLTSTNSCTLRAAIEEANALPNGASPDVILFTNIPVTSGTAIIYMVGDDLPTITDPIEIKGGTASGEVIINGLFADPSTGPFGLHLGEGSSGSTIRKLTIGNFSFFGIHVERDNNVIEKNYVGISKEGISLPNLTGIHVAGDYNRIGGVLKGNVVGKNELNGIYINDGYSAIIRGNYIGIAPDGTDIGNENVGLVLFHTSNAMVGGATSQYGNHIGNNETGISLSTSTYEAIIRNNFIGTDASGNDHGNVGAGIFFQSGTSDHLIGGTKQFGNVIGFNEMGIAFWSVIDPSENIRIRGNYIGIDRSDRVIANEIGILVDLNAENNVIGYAADVEIPLDPNKANTISHNTEDGIVFADSPSYTAVQNTIRGNILFENGELGLDLEDDGLTPNDASDIDPGPNTLLNFPSISRAFYRAGSDELAVEYSISSHELFVSYPLTVDVYLADDATSGEGKTYIGTDMYTAANVADTFSVDASSVTWAPEDYIVLTTTDADGNTSEFSPAAGPLDSGVGSVAWSSPRESIQVNQRETTSVSVHPNPFNPATTVTFFQSESSPVRLAIYDLTGRQVALLHHGELAGGVSHRFTLDGSKLASGTYLLLVAGGNGYVKSYPIVLLK